MEKLIEILNLWYVDLGLNLLFLVVGYLAAKKYINDKLILVIGQIAYDMEKKTKEGTTIDDILDDFLSILSIFGFNFDKETVKDKIEDDIKN